MNSSAAAEADFEDATGHDTRIRDQIEQRTAHVLRFNPGLRYRIRPHHPLDQFVGHTIDTDGLHHRRVNRGGAHHVHGDALLGDF